MHALPRSIRVRNLSLMRDLFAVEDLNIRLSGWEALAGGVGNRSSVHFVIDKTRIPSHGGRKQLPLAELGQQMANFRPFAIT
jgi:hypothetical protein